MGTTAASNIPCSLAKPNHFAAQRLYVLRASLMSLQTRVPTSMTDWCISGFTVHAVPAWPWKNLRLNVRTEIARLRINRLIFLFNPDAQAWPVHLVYSLPTRFLTCLDTTAGFDAGSFVLESASAV